MILHFDLHTHNRYLYPETESGFELDRDRSKNKKKKVSKNLTIPNPHDHKLTKPTSLTLNNKLVNNKHKNTIQLTIVTKKIFFLYLFGDPRLCDGSNEPKK